MKSLNLNNTKKLVLGLLVAVLAIGFSAFKSATKVVDPEWVYVQTSEDVYEQITYTSYDEDCSLSSLQPCSFIQDPSDPNDHGPTKDFTALDGISSMSPTSPGLYNQESLNNVKAVRFI